MKEVKTLTKSEFARKAGTTPDHLGKFMTDNPGALLTECKPDALIVDCPENFEKVKNLGKNKRGRAEGYISPKKWFAGVEEKNAAVSKFALAAQISIEEAIQWLTEPKESQLSEDKRKALKKFYKQMEK